MSTTEEKATSENLTEDQEPKETATAAETAAQSVDDTAAEDQKKLRQFKVAYPVQQLGGGIEKAYLSTYLSYLYTNVYMMPAAFSGLITIIQSIVGWIGGPLFGTIMDKVSFKHAKYYPWMIIGPVIYYVGWMLIYCLPMFGITGATGAVIALILAIINALVSPLVTVPTNAVYPNLSAVPADRQYFARIQKICATAARPFLVTSSRSCCRRSLWPPATAPRKPPRTARPFLTASVP